MTQSPRAMAKFLKEAARVKQVLSANSEIFAQVSIVLLKVSLGEVCLLSGLAYLEKADNRLSAGLSIDVNPLPQCWQISQWRG